MGTLQFLFSFAMNLKLHKEIKSIFKKYVWKHILFAQSAQCLVAAKDVLDEIDIVLDLNQR